jgi:hypothetical protein
LITVFWLECGSEFINENIMNKIVNFMEQEDFETLEMLEIRGGASEKKEGCSNTNCYGAQCVAGCACCPPSAPTPLLA